ncbi:lipopolysaccharide biosynthesis protein [Christiangramia echinicola]|uniref:lipopolysaccharide biosynthesis protein n=1 Tax=Christiangramia echinicola TaxID=279359 RepID=UPI000404323C|nr:lipopolysaccharide biosynthesis protein [Christiangramia echinicola]
MSLRKQAVFGLMWTFAQQFGNQLIGFSVSLVLARILLPEEFGLIAMIAVFVAVGNGLLDSGLSKSLIRDGDADNSDYSTVFFFNLFAGLLIYLLAFISAPLISQFYDYPILTNIIRVYCLSFLFTAATSVQLARLTKEMKFRTQTLVALPAAVIAGILGIVLAIKDFGVWSLVYSSLVNAIVSCILIWKYSGWYPSLSFNTAKFKKHWDYGYKLGLADLLNRFFNNIFLVIIGKYFSAAQLGFYSRAETMKQFPVSNLDRALNKVSFPLFIEIKDDPRRLRVAFKKLLKMVIFVVSPVLLILAAMAEPLFRFFFTEKWLPSAPYFQVLCLSGLLFPLHSYNLGILNIYGRSDLFLKLEVYKKFLIVLVILLAIPFGIYGLLWGQVALSLVAFFINAKYTQKYIFYSPLRQLWDIVPFFMVASFSALLVWGIDYCFLKIFSDLIRLLSGITIGASFYLLISKICKFEQLSQLYDLTNGKIKRNLN